MQEIDETQEWPGPEWPGPVDTRNLEVAEIDGGLNSEQEARSTALYHARAALETRAAMGSSKPPTVNELLRVADWIIGGFSD